MSSTTNTNNGSGSEGSTPAAKRAAENVKVDAAVVAAPFREEIRGTIARLSEASGKPFRPLLVGFLASDPGSNKAGQESPAIAAAKKYAEWTRVACEADGIEFQLRECAPFEVEEKLKAANQDPSVHGIMIYYPCFGNQPSFYGGSMDDYLRDCVAVEKDVEGLCFTYRRNLYNNIRYLLDLDDKPTDKKCVHPCTPLAVVKILDFLGLYDSTVETVGEKLKGKVVTVINRSEVVGRPLAAMLANDGARVYSVDIDSIYVMERGRMIPCTGNETAESVVKQSHAVILGVPSKDYKLPVEWITMPGAIVVNVSNFKNVDEAALLSSPYCKDIKYVPLVGKVTVAMLERNLLRLIENFHSPKGPKLRVIEAGGRVVSVNQ